jgi:hypothetical protein
LVAPSEKVLRSVVRPDSEVSGASEAHCDHVQVRDRDRPPRDTATLGLLVERRMPEEARLVVAQRKA